MYFRGKLIQGYPKIAIIILLQFTHTVQTVHLINILCENKNFNNRQKYVKNFYDYFKIRKKISFFSFNYLTKF